VSHVQDARNVGWRNDNGVWLLRWINGCFEIAAVFPMVLPFGFCVFWLVFGLRHLVIMAAKNTQLTLFKLNLGGTVEANSQTKVCTLNQ